MALAPQGASATERGATSRRWRPPLACRKLKLVLRGIRIRRSAFARTMAAFALLAMVVRALIPAGYMFAPSQDGRFVSVVLCSGHDAVLDMQTGAVLDAGAAPSDNSPTNTPRADGPCVFATMAPLAAPEPTAAIPAALRIVVAEAARALSAGPDLGLAAPPPWATGPPTTV